jgi:aminoglycoside phosphotransferase (APT) family kinase protein
MDCDRSRYTLPEFDSSNLIEPMGCYWSDSPNISRSPAGPRHLRKSGPTVHVGESRILDLIRQYTSIPVPKVIARGHDNISGDYFDMEEISGVPLDECWDCLSAEEQDSIAEQLRGYWKELRSMNSDVLRRDFVRDRFFFPRCKDSVGPYVSTHDFMEALTTRLAAVQYAGSRTQHVVGFLGLLLSNMDQDLVLTHGDLHPKNIFVRDGKVVGIVGWSQAGYRPPYWEYVKANLWDWDRETPFYEDGMMDKIIEPCLPELCILLHARDLIW